MDREGGVCACLCPCNVAQPGQTCLVPSESGHQFLLPCLGDLSITILMETVLKSWHSTAGTIGDLASEDV